VASRNLTYEVLVLRAKEIPSGSRVATMLSADVGLIDAFVFGGPKSKLRSLASPWSSGRAFLYHDPVRDYLKLSDLEVTDPHSGLRDGLRKIMSASLVAELLIKTSGGGGDYPEVLALARDCLHGLERLPESRTDYPLVLFIWRLVGIVGLLPDTRTCVLCDREFADGEARTWLQGEGGFACLRCRPSRAEGAAAGSNSDSSAPSLSSGAVRWLERAAVRPFAEALDASLDASSLAGLRRLAFGLARSAAEGTLESLHSGSGIL
jgi:DNA repair protein RecO (recombination protein O)